MARKISARVREEAALICAIAASNRLAGDYGACYDKEIAQWLGLWRGSISKTVVVPSVSLALAAWLKVYNAADSCAWTANIDAEAESLLRCGWSPGDEP